MKVTLSVKGHVAYLLLLVLILGFCLSKSESKYNTYTIGFILGLVKVPISSPFIYCLGGEAGWHFPTFYNFSLEGVMCDLKPADD